MHIQKASDLALRISRLLDRIRDLMTVPGSIKGEPPVWIELPIWRGILHTVKNRPVIRQTCQLVKHTSL
jgi:hypothetical protein